MTDEEFEKSVVDKQHNDLLRAIRSIVIPTPNDSGIIAAIRENNSTIATFVSKLQSISAAPNVQVTTNNDAVIQSISDMAERINGSLQMLIAKLSEPRQPMEMEFMVTRSNGYISGIKLKESK